MERVTDEQYLSSAPQEGLSGLRAGCWRSLRAPPSSTPSRLARNLPRQSAAGDRARRFPGLGSSDLREIETAFSRIKVHGGRMNETQMAQIGKDRDGRSSTSLFLQAASLAACR